MSWSPLAVGQTSPALSGTATVDGGSALNLTGATCTLVFDGPTGQFTGTGTLNIVSATAGTFTYQQSAADVATAGAYTYRLKAVYAGGTVYSDQKNLLINPV